jgi:PKD repeat protein
MRRTFLWLSAVLVFTATIITAVTAINSANAQSTQAPQMAYVQLQLEWNCATQPIGNIDDCASFIYSVTSSSVVTPFGGINGLDTLVTWSADATKISFVDNGDIFIADASGSSIINITNTANNLAAPAWSPDGSRIAFASTRDNPSGELYLMNPDGSNVVRLTYNVAFSVGGPAWSHDGKRIAFNCQVESGNDDICAINADGTGFVRLTSDPSSDVKPTWSPDGASLAFATNRYIPYQYEIAVMNADGSGVTQVGGGIGGSQPAWSPDGAQFAFVTGGDGIDVPPSIYTMQADGTNVVQFMYSAQDPAWMPERVPVATFKFACSVGTCSFDASGSTDSYGTITGYAWNFGDGTTAAGVNTVHTFIGGNKYTVTLTVTDSNGASGTKFQIIAISSPVTASFVFACHGLTCSFDGSGSHDSDGTITSYAWTFGDGTSGSGLSVTHTYPAGGKYTVVLIVTDNAGATNAQSKTVAVNAPPVASFTFACSRFTCSFDASSSYDSDGSIASWTWNLGDGTTLAGNYPEIGHTYSAPGTYTVTLTVTDNGGATGRQSNSVTVVRPK